MDGVCLPVSRGGAGEAASVVSRGDSLVQEDLLFSGWTGMASSTVHVGPRGGI